MRYAPFLLLLASLITACGSPSQEAAPKARYQVAVAAQASSSEASERNWERFLGNVKVWAPQYTVTLQGEQEAGDPPGWASAVREGRLQLAALPPAQAEALVPELGVLRLPGLFASHEEADHVLDQAVFETYRKLFLAHDLALLEWFGDDWADPQSRREYRSGVIVAGKGWFDRLTPHDRDVFAHAYGSAGQARADARAATAGMEPGAAGELDDALRAAHAAAVEAIGGSAALVYEQVLQGKASFAAGRAAAPAQAPPSN